MASALSDSLHDSPNLEMRPLEQGEHLDRETFHARYRSMPPGTRAELIEGVVHMPSPVFPPHSRSHTAVLAWLTHYVESTPGVEAFAEVTTVLPGESEVQPDALLTVSQGPLQVVEIHDERGVIGVPELVVEIASSTSSFDLHQKLYLYERAGVPEYLVVLVRDRAVRWFTRREGRLREQSPGPDALLRSTVFPGLWLDPEALLRLDTRAAKAALDLGLASPEHAEFLRQLQPSAT